MAAFLALLEDVETMSRLTFFTVSYNTLLRYLEGLEQPAYFPGSTSSEVMDQRFQQLTGSRCEAKADFPRMLSEWKTH